jgi:uroporphyrinogen decarboxylase
MDSLERTALALEHQEPDRVPIDCWASAATRVKLENALGMTYEGFLDRADVDFRYIEGPAYVGPIIDGPVGAADVDGWGVPRRRVDVEVDDGSGSFSETYKEVLVSPLASCRTPGQVEGYAYWPSPDWYDYSTIEAQCDRIRDRGRVAVFMGDRLNRLAQLKPAMYLRGTEQIFVDLVENPEIAELIFGKIRSFYLTYGQRILEAARGKIDILCTGDDFGSQNGPLMSPLMWDHFLREGFEAYIRLGHDHGAHVMHHTCGAVYDLMPRFIEGGLDILQSLQPEAAGMDPRGIKDRFGDQLSFQGGISIQRVLPRSTPARVREHVTHVLGAMKRGGGYIAGTSHNIQTDVPVAAIQALFAAYHDAGRYL